MKRIIILAAAVLAITGCSNDLPPGPGNGDPSDIVTFSTKRATRGTPVVDVSQLDDIGTFGYYTGQSKWTTVSPPNRMFNRRLYCDGGEWKYDGDPVEWDGNIVSDMFTFYAYAPYATADNGIVVNGDATTTGIPTLTYTVPTDVTKQPDLMVAVPRVDIVKPASGYVSLNMQHALTTIGFQVAGNGERITGISVAGVSMTGTLKLDGGNIEWSDLDTPPEAADFSASINFDDGQNYFTATPSMSTNLMKGDGYLMMIPQTLDDEAALVVSYEDGSSIEINIDPHEWLPGRKIIYELTIVQGGVIVVDPSEISMPYAASRSRILVECSNLRGDPAPSLEWTLTTSEAWLTLSLNSDGTNADRTLNGEGTQTVYVFSTLNDTGNNRTATITLDGTENVVTNVLQHYSAAQRFARSNIVMWVDGNGNKILTFAEVEADHTQAKSVTYYDASSGTTVTGSVPAIPANVQGLHFRWGSLVGITSNGGNNTAFSSSHVVFWPTEYSPRVPGTWVFNGGGMSVNGQVPYVNGSMGSPADAFADYPNGAGPGFDKESAMGDICRYISDMGWVRGKWRMPTPDEVRALTNETPEFYRNEGGRNAGPWDTTRDVSDTGDNSQYGYFRIFDIRVAGLGVNGNDGSDALRLNPGVAKVTFPATGYRNGSNGNLTSTGTVGHYWEASPSDPDRAYNLYYEGNSNYHPANIFARTNGYAVRCVLE